MDGKIFWENTPDTTWNTYLGYNSLISGMEKGLIGACAGERRLIKIPPSWGYGERGSSSGAVPPSAVLLFEVTMVDFHNPKDQSEMTDVTVDPTEECKKIPEDAIVDMKYKAYLQNGQVLEDIDNLKAVYKSRGVVYGLYMLMKVCLLSIRPETQLFRTCALVTATKQSSRHTMVMVRRALMATSLQAQCCSLIWQLMSGGIRWMGV